MRKTIQTTSKYFFIVAALIGVVATALFLAQMIQNNPDLQATIAGFGYLGVLVLAIIAGVNVFIPIPAASFTPAFLAAGLSLPFIIITLAIGTIIADYIGYAFGRWSRAGISEKYPTLLVRYEKLVTTRRLLLIPVIFLFAAFIPFPNEAIILPLAVLGIQFRLMLEPLLLGNIIHQTLLSYGAQNLFLWWF
jgi:membrane protein DedA with SNARE-associated domain